MKKLFGLFLLAIACWAPGVANAATCFWVGGTGSINDTTKWSSSSGGAGSTCASAGGWPNASTENGTFDGSSGGGTITRNVAWTIGTLNIAAFTGTFGNAGDTTDVQLDTLTNNGAGLRTWNMGTGTWTCGRSGAAACTWNVAGATNLTFPANTSTLVMNGSFGGAPRFAWVGNLTYNVITLNADANAPGTDMNGVFTATTLNIAAPNYIETRSNFSVTNLNFTGGTPSFSAMTVVKNNSFNSPNTITLTNPSTCSYCIFSTVSVATSSITATNSFKFSSGGTNINVTNPSGGGGGGGRIIGG